MVLCLFAFLLPLTVQAQQRKSKADEKVYLEHADELTYDESRLPGVQIVKGKVRFKYKDTSLISDSAYFDQQQNMFKAFGHVKMRKSGGITMDCDRATYNGNTELTEARGHVVLTQPGRSLHCDSLNYRSDTEYANFFGGNGGTLKTGDMTVVSKDGDYYMETHIAHFTGDVHLSSPKYDVDTNYLEYNTDTERAHILGPSVIRGKDGEVINTNDGYFNGKNDEMELRGRSVVTTKEREIVGDYINYNSKTGDNVGRGNVLFKDKVGDRVVTGDSLTYNEKTGVGQGKGHVVYTDNKNRNMLTAEYVHYTDSAAIAYGDPVVKEFSQKDTLFMRSDTIRMKAFHLNTDSLRREVYCYNNVRAYRTDLQAVCGLLILNSKDSCMTMHQDPIVWNGPYRQLLGDSIKAFMNDSTVREAYVYGNALSVEKMDDEGHFNQISSKEMRAFFVEGNVRRGDAIGNVLAIYYPVDDKDSSIILMNYTETDTMRMYLSAKRQMERIWTSKATGTMYPLTQIPTGKDKLRDFAWFENVRPRDKHDIYRRVGKEDSKKLQYRQVVLPPKQRIMQGDTERNEKHE